MKIEKKYLEIPIDCIKDLIIEPCLKFNSEGLFIKAFAESNAAMCVFEIPKSKFVQYEIEGEQKFKVNTELLSKIMNSITTQFINLNFKDEKLIISDENKKKYSIAVMYDDEVERDIPNLELNSNFKMKSSDLRNIFMNASIVSDNIKLETRDGKLIVSAKELNSFDYELECESKGECQSYYSLEYLNKFLNASKYFENVLFEFSSDSPCKLTFKDELEIRFILAARCE